MSDARAPFFQIWWADPATYAHSETALALLSRAERIRHDRFVREETRHEFLVTRVLVRTVLGRALGMEPGTLQFTQNEFGRPELDPPSPYRFSLSNSHGLTVCMLSAGVDLGIDTEPLDRAHEVLNLAGTVFAPAELEALLALDERARPRRALQLWTLKEAYLKARGVGLSLPLKQFAFEFGGEIRVHVDAALEDSGDRWQFLTLTLGEHLVSTAIACPLSQPLSIDVHEAGLDALTRR